jgi:S1-C subfamily serine protease
MSDQPASSVLLTLSAGLAALVRDVAPSLVSIQSARSRSTGFSWRPGLIVAAENALPDDDEHSIVAHDGASAPARVVGRDPSTDVALLRLERNDLPRAPSAAGAPTAGALAIVAGAREGAAAAALGVVSFVGPQWRSLRGGLVDARIELDAALARSSEGGLALDASGQALGMAVFGPRRRTLVIPMTTIDRVADVLATKGRIARG